jgi:hypothetical protein
MRRTGMMQRFLDALERIAAYQTDDLVALPGHGPAFSNLAERCGQLRDHHLKREETILNILRERGEPMTIYEVAQSLWKKLPGYHIVLAISEVNSHLEKAVTDGLIMTDDGRFWVI